MRKATNPNNLKLIIPTCNMSVEQIDRKYHRGGVIYCDKVERKGKFTNSIFHVIAVCEKRDICDEENRNNIKILEEKGFCNISSYELDDIPEILMISKFTDINNYSLNAILRNSKLNEKLSHLSNYATNDAIQVACIHYQHIDRDRYVPLAIGLCTDYESQTRFEEMFNGWPNVEYITYEELLDCSNLNQQKELWIEEDMMEYVKSVGKLRRFVETEKSYEDIRQWIENALPCQKETQYLATYIHSWLQFIVGGLPIKSNMLVSADEKMNVDLKTSMHSLLSYIAGDTVEVFTVDMNAYNFKEKIKDFVRRQLNPLFAKRNQGIGVVFLDHYDAFYERCRNAKEGYEIMNELSMILNGMVLVAAEGKIDTDNILFICTGTFDKLKNRGQSVSRKTFHRNQVGRAMTSSVSRIICLETLDFENTYEYCNQYVNDLAVTFSTHIPYNNDIHEMVFERYRNGAEGLKQVVWDILVPAYPELIE